MSGSLCPSALIGCCLCRFVIGRERPGQVSEVASLIQQTLEQEKKQREALELQYAQYDADDDEVLGGGCVCVCVCV